MKLLLFAFILIIALSPACSQKTEHAPEDLGPVKTYKTMKGRTDSIQAKSRQHSNVLDSIAGQ